MQVSWGIFKYIGNDPSIVQEAAQTFHKLAAGADVLRVFNLAYICMALLQQPYVHTG